MPHSRHVHLNVWLFVHINQAQVGFTQTCIAGMKTNAKLIPLIVRWPRHITDPSKNSGVALGWISLHNQEGLHPTSPLIQMNEKQPVNHVV